ncbi:MAG: hypothetical protein LBS36_10960 [Oscillospiraceae bacterium]|nr:hypothetical protein [Oscillospiraceae bacterium]
MTPIGIIFLACFFLYIAAGRFMDYYSATQLLTELFTLGKEMISVIMVPAMLIEIVDTATGKQNTETEAEDKK